MVVETTGRRSGCGRGGIHSTNSDRRVAPVDTQPEIFRIEPRDRVREPVDHTARDDYALNRDPP